MQRKRLLKLLLGFIVTLTFISLYSCSKNNSSPIPRKLDINEDIDGNHYDTLRIGKQLWMVQPLRVTRFNDGTAIPYLSKGSDWAAAGTNPARCYYGADGSNSDSATYASTYGALYNWAAVHSGKLAPKGWHIADTTEWNTLIGTLNGNPNFTGGNDPNVGGRLKEPGPAHWVAPNPTNNSIGFKALAAGFRSYNGNFTNLGVGAYFWSSTEYVSTDAYHHALVYDSPGIIRSNNSKLLGFSVVCIRDN